MRQKEGAHFLEFSSKGVSENRHHEQAKWVQLKFKRHVSTLVGMIMGNGEMGNPFAEDSNNLLKLGSRELADHALVDAVRLQRGRANSSTNFFVAEETSTSFLKAQSKTKLAEKWRCIIFQTLNCLSDLRWEQRKLLQTWKSGLPSNTLTSWRTMLRKGWSVKLPRKQYEQCPTQCLTKLPQTVRSKYSIGQHHQHAELLFQQDLHTLYLNEKCEGPTAWMLYVTVEINSLKSQTRQRQGKGTKTRVDG